MAGGTASRTGGLWRVLRIVGWVLVIAVALFVVGWILELVRFAAAQLPAVDAVGDMSVWQILSHGALWSAEAIVVGAVLGAVAWVAARRSWKATPTRGAPSPAPEPIADRTGRFRWSSGSTS